MSQYVDNTPISQDPITSQDIKDAKEERDQAEYDAMYDLVEEEMRLVFDQVNGLSVHREVMRRLKEKYGH